MNSKLIAIIAVVAMCGAALVGVGYAYTAEYTTPSNSATSESNYITISPGGDALGKVELSLPITYNTITNASNSGSISYKVMAESSEVYQTVTVNVNHEGAVADTATEVVVKVLVSEPTLSSTVVGGDVTFEVWGNGSKLTVGNDGYYTLTKKTTDVFEITYKLIFTSSSSSTAVDAGDEYANLANVVNSTFTTVYKAEATVPEQNQSL